MHHLFALFSVKEKWECTAEADVILESSDDEEMWPTPRFTFQISTKLACPPGKEARKPSKQKHLVQQPLSDYFRTCYRVEVAGTHFKRPGKFNQRGSGERLNGELAICLKSRIV